MPQDNEKKSGDTARVFGIIKDFLKSYKEKDSTMSNEAWLAEQFAKPEYADAWKGENQREEQLATAKGIVQGVEGYENAKKSLRSHIEDKHGSRESWLAEQIEIGAEINNADPAEYADEIARGLVEANEEGEAD